MMAPDASANRTGTAPVLSLYRLLDPEVLADPYPLYRALMEKDRVQWDPFLHSWVVTGYAEVLHVLHKFSADRTPTPEQLKAMGLPQLEPIAAVMVKQMLFLDGATHARLRGLCSAAFTSRRVDGMREQIQDIADGLVDKVAASGRMDVIGDFAAPLPAIVTATLMGLPTADHAQLKSWSADFAEMLGNFQHNPERAGRVLKSLNEMIAYFRSAIRDQQREPRPGLIQALLAAEVEGQHLDEEEVIANIIVTMVGGQETTTNLIGNGMLTLVRNPDALAQLRDAPDIIESAVEELLRYESPSQHTGRITPHDMVLGDKELKKGAAVMAVMAAGNRDPLRFPDPDRLDLLRTDNRHLAFGWAAHFCFGAPLARIEGQIAFNTLLRRLPGVALEPVKLEWRENLGLRGLKSLPVRLQQAVVPA
jgi:pimeloyl-[acyl-carrier protein] synthase